MTDQIDAGRHFNEAVKATAAFGELTTKVTDTNDRLARMEPKLDKVVSTMDRWGGAIAISSAAISIAVTLIVSLLKP